MAPKSQRGWRGRTGAEAKLTRLELVSKRHFHTLFIFLFKSLSTESPELLFRSSLGGEKQTNIVSRAPHCSGMTWALECKGPAGP